MSRTAPTEAGEALLAAIETTFAQLGAACAAVRARGRRPVLAISANSSIAALWLAPRLAAFAARHPSVAWQMRAIEAAPDLVRDALDLAIVRGRPGALGPHDRLLFRETVFPVAAPALALRGVPEELLRHNLLEEEHGSSAEKGWAAWFAPLGLGPHPRVTIVRFDTFAAAISAAVAGAGVALGRWPLIAADLAAGRLVRLFAGQEMPGSWDIVLRHRAGAARDGHVGQLADFLLEEAARG